MLADKQMKKEVGKKIEHKPVCFVLMPISDLDGYDIGHFKRVYEDLLKPACEKAGYDVIRADDVFKTNFIQLDILQKLLDSDMAICDLSTRNPNVLYELGLRQAFDKPTVLVQEHGTPKIFDISPLRYIEYNPSLKYREVLIDQENICRSILETAEASIKSEGVNSLVKLLSINSAKMKDVAETDEKQYAQALLNDFNKIKRELGGYVSTISSLNVNNNGENLVLSRIDAFEKSIALLETSISNKSFSSTILIGLYEQLDREYNYLNSIALNEFHRRIISDLYHRFWPLRVNIH